MSDKLRPNLARLRRAGSPSPSTTGSRSELSSPTLSDSGTFTIPGQHGSYRSLESSKQPLPSPGTDSNKTLTPLSSQMNLQASTASSIPSSGRPPPPYRAAISSSGPNKFTLAPSPNPGSMLNSPSMLSLASNGPATSQNSSQGSSPAAVHSPSLPPSTSTTNLTFNFSKFDARNVAAAMDRLENKDRMDGSMNSRMEIKAGELGSVGAVGFGGGDEWQTVCVRVLPLFNGEGAKGYIEDLNELVSLHIQRILSKTERKAIQHLTEHFTELCSIGMLTLNSKLQNLSDERLLIRLNEIWIFFFASVLPYLEGVFLPFSTDRELMRINSKYSTSQPQSLAAQLNTAINVRKLILTSFRDQIIYPITERLITLFAQEASRESSSLPPSRRASEAMGATGVPVSTSGYRTPSATAARSVPSMDNLSNSSTIAAKAAAGTQTDTWSANQAKRMQMISILASVLSGDEKQRAVEHLARSLRGTYSIRKFMDSPSVEFNSLSESQVKQSKREKRQGMSADSLSKMT